MGYDQQPRMPGIYHYSALLLFALQLLTCQQPAQCTHTNKFKSPETKTSHRSHRTQLVQHFNAQPLASAATATANYTHRQLVFVALLPSVESDNKNDCIMPKVLPILELGIRHVQRLGFPGALIDITLISRDTFCSSKYGPIGFFEICTQWPEVNAIFGLPCEYVLAPISRYADVWQVPVLTTGGNAKEFNKKSESYSTLTRLKGAQVNNVGNVVRAILDNFNWTRTALLYQNENAKTKGNSVCFLCLAAVHDTIEKQSVYQVGFDTTVWTKADITRMLHNVARQTRIVIMCADPQSIRQIMLTAEELNMIDSGEYVFINIELFSRVPYLTSQPWYDRNDTTRNNERARKAYTAMLTVTPKQPNDDDYTRVSNEIKAIAATKYNYTFSDNEPISAFVTSFFDGVLLYANALNDSIREDPSVLNRPINGTDMVRRMWNRSFTGITGNVTIDANGDRLSAYSLLDMNPKTGRFEIVAHFLHNRLDYEPDKVIHWAGDREEAPPDRPTCGYDGSLCPDNSLPGYAILSIVLGMMVIIMAVCFFFGYRHYKSEAEINSMTWKVSIDEVIFRDTMDRYIRGSFHSLVKQSSQLTLMSEDMGSINGDRQIFIPVGMFRGCKVAIKNVDEDSINLTRGLMLELKRMKDLQHDHLVKFYGACLDTRRSFLLTEYCQKGSLQDILENEQFQLDWMFKLSLMHDIVRGMQFLHNSDIRSHGNLKSSNCVVDSRFVLKVTDFGLHTLRHARYDKESDVENCNSHAFWSKLLWTSPELLKMENNRPPEGTQKGDVYSFGIIMHEITTRQGPFYLGKTEKSPQEIIELVKGCPHLTRVPFRPDIEDTHNEINAIMVRCWSEDPAERPDFNTLKTTIRKTNKENETGNIVDNLLKRMEMYANNLEELVEERTQDYNEEKKKCEKLLYQLLPQSVAAQLISGQPVIAETFDQVTIYFSDIVGFTAISAESTPMQVVQFLNDLYTCFDSIVENFDVYKVETIGDAYMVVSGLPIRNGSQHAREIARLALALLEAVHNFRIHHRPDDRLKLRIGLHTGACVAGVVGLKMPRYCLFGDTVNTASRMESNGEALRIHISETTKVALDEYGTFITTKRGFVPVKGKGEMLTYWLEGEVPRPNMFVTPNRQLLARRSSLKHPTAQRYAAGSSLHKQYSDLATLTAVMGVPDALLPHVTIPTIDEPNGSRQDYLNESESQTNLSNLRVKRKISSSSPKLNGAEFKTDEYNYYMDAGGDGGGGILDKTRQKVQQCDIYSSRSLRETQRDDHWELANFRLPLSGALKNHNNNNIRHSYINSNSNLNLSGILQPNAARMRLKQSPTISTLVTAAMPDNGSICSGNRIKFADNETTTTTPSPTATATTATAAAAAAPAMATALNKQKADIMPQHNETSNCKAPLLEPMSHKPSAAAGPQKPNRTATSPISAANTSVPSALGEHHHNHNHHHVNNHPLLKANNVKNYTQLLCKSNSMALVEECPTNRVGTSAVSNNGVTQPLLAKINS